MFMRVSYPDPLRFLEALQPGNGMHGQSRSGVFDVASEDSGKHLRKGPVVV